MRWTRRRDRLSLLAVFGILGTLLGAAFSTAAEPPPGDLWAYAAAERPGDRPPLTGHRDVAGLLDAMLDGDAAVMFLDPPRFQALSVDEFKALRVTFAARDAELKLVARLLKRWLRGRVEFVPRAPEDHLTLTLRSVPFAEVVAALASLGKVQVLPPPARRPGGSAASSPAASPGSRPTNTGRISSASCSRSPTCCSSTRYDA